MAPCTGRIWQITPFRKIDRMVKRDLCIFGAVLIQGPKWCGKTTTAQQFASSSLSLSNPAGGFAARQLAELDPARAIVGPTPRLIDEWQEVPSLWDAVRFECDSRGGRPGQFILTGSATPRDTDQPMHSGVGRVSRLRMDTMSLLELGVSSGVISLGALLSGKPVETALGSISGVLDVADLLCRGGWPQAVGRTTDEAMRIAAAYIDGVCESDVSRTDGVRRDPTKVRALLASLARNESTFAGLSSITKDVGGDVSKNSISRYLDALRRINVVDDIPAWHPALRSPVKLREGAKRHLADPSLAVALIGANPESLSSDPKTLGLLFESLVPHDLKVYTTRSSRTTTTGTAWRQTPSSTGAMARGSQSRSSSAPRRCRRRRKTSIGSSTRWSHAAKDRPPRSAWSSDTGCRHTRWPTAFPSCRLMC